MIKALLAHSIVFFCLVSCATPEAPSLFEANLSEYSFDAFELMGENEGRMPASINLVDDKKEYLKTLFQEMDKKAKLDILRQFIRYDFSWALYTKDKKTGKESSLLETSCEGAFRPRTKKDYSFAKFECGSQFKDAFFDLLPQNTKFVLEKIIEGKTKALPSLTYKNKKDQEVLPQALPFPSGIYTLGTDLKIRKNFSPDPIEGLQEVFLTLSDLKMRKNPLNNTLSDIFFIFEMEPKDQEKILTAERKDDSPLVFYPAKIIGLISLNAGLPSFTIPTYRSEITEIAPGGEIREYSFMAFQRNIRNTQNIKVKGF